MSTIPGLPDKWKLIYCSATNSDIPDHPMGKWRDADILNLLREIAGLSNDNKLIRLNHPFGTMYDVIKKAQADNKALLEENERLKEFLSTALRGRPTEEDLAWADDQIAKIEAAHAQKEHSEPQ